MTAPRVIPSTITREPAKFVADVLQEEMDLDDAHCLLGDSEWHIPADKELFVAVFDGGGPVISTVNFLDADATSTTYGKEIQQSTILHDIRIEIMSFDADARLRKEEVGMAMASMFAQQEAERYRMGLGRAQVPVNATDSEPTGRLLKYVTHINVTALHQKVKDPPTGKDYFTKFNGATTAGTANPPQVTSEA